MNWQLALFTSIVLIAATISFTVAFIAWRRRPVAGASYLTLLMLVVSEWSLGYIVELLSSDLSIKITAIKIQYVGVVITPLAWLLFALDYTGRERWLTRRNLILLAIPPFTTLLMVWTSELHTLFWRTVELDDSGAFPVLGTTHGIYFWVHTIFSYLSLLVGTLLLIQMFIRATSLYRGQTAVLVIGALVPWVGNFLHISGLSPLDLSSLAFALTGLIFLWGIFRFRLLDIVPVARNAVVESMSDAVFVLDVQDRVVDINPAASNVVGCTANEAIGQPIAQLLSDQSELVEHYQDVLDAQTEITVGEGEMVRYLDLRISALHRGKRLAGRLVVLRDITERVLARQELDAFAHTVAHDLKNPLSLSIGYAELLEMQSAEISEEKRQSYIRAIARGGHKMRNIIDELLLLAKVRQLDEVAVEPLDMATVVAEALERLEHMIDEYQAEIRYPAPQHWPAALGYAPWIEEVWTNYINNALKYGGSPPLVELGTDEGTNGSVRFWVRDNGTGLTTEEQAVLFTPFTRLSQARVEGHGLGLSIVRRIVEKLGGQVDVESTVGEGSIFSFTLPVAVTSD